MKTENEVYQGWLEGIIRKRPADILTVLCNLTTAGLANGQVSANDITTSVSHSSSIGSAMKLMRRIGFVSTGTIVPRTKPSAHRRFVFQYRLERRDLAEKFLSRISQHLLSMPPDDDAQGRLPL